MTTAACAKACSLGLAYVALFVVAVVANKPLGSPIALPLSALLLTGATLAASLLVFAPATLLASLMRPRRSACLQVPSEQNGLGATPERP
jgi:hypothetical protein